MCVLDVCTTQASNPFQYLTVYTSNASTYICCFLVGVL